jgi:hypothetical protein
MVEGVVAVTALVILHGSYHHRYRERKDEMERYGEE